MKIIVLIFLLGSTLFGGTATSVTDLYTTGINGAWLMSNNASAYIIKNNVVSRNSWMANSATSKWISYTPSTVLPTSIYAYALSFNINGFGGSGSMITNYVAITLTWTSDDTSSLYLNGSRLGITQSGWTTTKTVTFNSTTSNLKIGSNLLVVEVNNSGGGPTGLMVTGISASISPTPPIIPEMGAWLPVFGAFMVVMWLKIKRKTA